MKNTNIALAVVVVLGAVVGLGRAAEVAAPGQPMSVWFVSPAKSFHESCPLGNGRLGAMDFGGVDRDRIMVCEQLGIPRDEFLSVALEGMCLRAEELGL